MIIGGVFFTESGCQECDLAYPELFLVVCLIVILESL